MTAYYNEIDPYAASWLRELIKAGHIAPGDVDERSIEDVRPDELAGYTQCHFFAGIGGWSLALRLAGIPDDYPIWTGSCPCQPFSSAGAGAGFDDSRHLWPSFAWLIAQCRPAVVAGEQVASKATGPWFDLVQADLEAMGYAFGLAAFPAAGIGAPHIRDRAYWLGHRLGAGLEGYAGDGDRTPGRAEQNRPVAEAGGALRMADHPERGRREECQDGRGLAAGSGAQGQSAGRVPGGAVGGVADADSRQQPGQSIVRGAESDRQNAGRAQGGCESESCSEFCERPGPTNGHPDASEAGGVDNATGTRHQRQEQEPESQTRHKTRLRLPGAGYGQTGTGPAGPTNGQWRAADWLLCRDGKWRPVESRVEPVADGLSDSLGYRRIGSRYSLSPLIKKTENRVMRLRGYGNAIVPQQAAEFLRAALDGDTGG